MGFNVIYLKDAKKFIRKNGAYGLRFMKLFERLAENKKNLASKKFDVKLLTKCKKKAYRARIGNYRAVFKVIENDLLIMVVDIDSRGEIYKNLENKL
ncbi:type II toxin-antitoxin system RelE family toxin [Mesomycoplasma molare]|uniref:Type II toxin-antitoxin system RelE/ParE family toxin n=1 Tax=Mesomycoplasma molare TaxID=171288 RepID=A0ABY5TVN3_9BACT|nr:type II toxin-antitoxin system RelE/ParE family toxin [Mesomycoplasma molare]UWD34066.1 type II toxin-antitoxin system RelE/ParE family toxin [Mesomycoplasma molare]